MSTEHKIQRYREKDYSEIVEFPVELVDRDGVVRLYSYEDSLRVYLRRIASAPWRYADDTIIAAEVDHCNKRIDQLRRSYLLRCQNLGAHLAFDQHTTDQCILGEGLTLLHEYLGEDDEDPDILDSAGVTDLEITALAEGEPPAVYQVVRRSDDRLFLLYVYSADDAGAEEAFEEQRAVLANAATLGAGCGECLCLDRQGELAFFLLTERTSVVDEHAEAAVDDRVEPAVMSSPSWPGGRNAEEVRPAQQAFAAGLAALRRREPEEAIRELRATIELNPYHREAYLAVSTLLDMMGEVEEGGMYVAMAVAYYPEDGLIRFAQGLNLLRQGQRREALVAFEAAAGLDSGLYQPRYFAGLLFAIDGRLADAERMLRAGRDRTRRDRKRVDTALAWVRTRRRLRRWLYGGAGVFGLACAGVLVFQPWIGVGLGSVSLALVAAQIIQSRVARYRLARSASRALPGEDGDDT